MSPTLLESEQAILESEQTIECDLDQARWDALRSRFLEAIHPDQRTAVEERLRAVNRTGAGLRAWLEAAAGGGSPLPDVVPREVVAVYLEDPDALPLDDCLRCGMAVPVRPSPVDVEGDTERSYFPQCPRCGGPTGRHSYRSGLQQRRSNPRQRR